MEIKRLLLVGYRWFKQLKQIERFEYRPQLKTQLILGSNGSGKSSLMRELSPLPGNAGDYVKGGMKEIEISHKHLNYLLRSSFLKEGNRFEFIVDGIELNRGLTVTVFKELVFQHFGYTQEIHDLMTGRIKFTRMNAAERRAWLTRLSDVDFTYAIQYHQRLSTKVRDLQGAIKRNQERLAQETAKCVAPDEEQTLRTSIRELTLRLNELLRGRKPRLSDPSLHYHALDQTRNNLQTITVKLERLLLQSETIGLELNLPVLQECFTEVCASLQIWQNEVQLRCETVGKLQKSLSAVQQTSGLTIEGVRKLIEEIEEEQDTLLKQMHFQIIMEKAVEAEAAFGALKSRVQGLYEQMASLKSKDFTVEKWKKLYASIPGLREEVRRTEAEESSLFAKKKHSEMLREKEATTCPKCSHQWQIGFNEHEYKRLSSLHEASVTRVKALKAELEAWEESAGEHTCYFQTMDELTSISRQSPALLAYWQYLSKVYQESGIGMMISTLDRISYDLMTQAARARLEVRLQDAKKQEATMLEVKALDKSYLEHELDLENKAISTLQEKTQAAFIKRQSLDVAIKLRKNIDEVYQGYQEACACREKEIKALIEDNCISALDEVINQLRLTISQQERRLSMADVQRGIVKNLENQIQFDQEEHGLLKLAQKALSPTEGLIAQGMAGFINHFVGSTNQFIEKFWLYPLELTPVPLCEEQALDLNYRFPVLVNNSDQPTGDISLTSAGMQEVINLAFVAISMKYMHLTHFPIFLDEFAAALDTAHRQVAYRAIDVIIDSSDYSQVYIVSHYQDGYGGLSNAETLVLCGNNVQLPKHLVFNKHVTME